MPVYEPSGHQQAVKNIHDFVADSIPLIGESIAVPIASLIVIFIIDSISFIECIDILGTGIMFFILSGSLEFVVLIAALFISTAKRVEK